MPSRGHQSERSPYAPWKAHTQQQAVGSNSGEDEDTPSAAARLRPAHPSGRRDETMSDLERLEAKLRWIQREQAAARLPRTTQLPPVPGLAPVDDDYRSPRSLEPERLVPPAALMSRRDRLRWPLRIMVASVVAAPVAYYFSGGGSAPPSAHGPQMASVDPTAVAPPSTSKKQRLPIRAQDDDTASSALNETPAQRAKTPRGTRLSNAGTVAMLQPNETATPAPPPKRTVRAVDPEEIELLTKQGKQFAEVGDFVTARTLLQRAAEADDATAATALGATYDPTVLAKLGVVGISADLEKARFWYQKAASLGSSDAKRRLELLANR